MNNASWTLLETLINLVEVTGIQFYLHRKLGTRGNPLPRLLIGGASLWLLWYVMLIFPSLGENTLTRVCILTAGCIVYAAAVGRGHIGIRVFHAVLIFILLGLIDTGIACMFLLFPGVSMKDFSEQTLPRMQGMIASKILFLFTVYILSRKKADASLPLLVWCLLCAVPVLNVLIMGTIIQYEVKYALYSSPNLMMVTIGMLVISILILALFERFSSISQQNLRQTMMLQQAAMQKDYIREIEAANDQVRGFRHDYRNHIQVIGGYLQHQRYREIEQYLSEISHFLDDTDIHISTGNPTVDAVLGSKLIIARKNNIDVEYTVQIPEEVTISPMDLGCLLGNLMDNALEACMRMKDRETEKGIELTIDVHQEHLSIAISNTTDPIPDPRIYGLPPTRKGAGHGIGMANIRRIVDHYQGMMQIRCEENTFFVLILLPVRARSA